MENSPKIYFIKNAEGKFYNSVEKHFYPAIINANYEKKEANVKQILALGLERFQGCEVHTTTESEFMDEFMHQTTKLVLIGEYFHRALLHLSTRIPTISQVNKNLYQRCKATVKELIPFTVHHKNYLDNNETGTDEMQGQAEAYFEQLAKVEIFEMAEVTAIIKAYKINKKSILGTAKKVLR